MGGATGLFLGVRELASIYQNRQDPSNTVFAAAVTGGLFGLLGTQCLCASLQCVLWCYSQIQLARDCHLRTVQGPARARIRSSLLMATLGAAVGYPTGIAHDQLAMLATSGAPTPSGDHAQVHPIETGVVPEQPGNDAVEEVVRSLRASVQEEENTASLSKSHSSESKSGRRWWWPFG